MGRQGGPWPLGLLPLLAACVHGEPSACWDPADDSGSGDSSGDSTNDSAADSTDTSDTSTPDSSDTSDTGAGVPLPGSFTVTGTYDGAPVDLTCSESTDAALFTRYWGSSLGNVSGGFACGNERGERVSVGYISPTEGEWSDPSDGKSWIYEDGTGTVLAWGTPDTTAWSLAFTAYGFEDVTTVSLEGTLSGTWTTDGATFADLAGTFALQIPCTSGC